MGKLPFKRVQSNLNMMGRYLSIKPCACVTDDLTDQRPDILKIGFCLYLCIKMFEKVILPHYVLKTMRQTISNAFRLL